MHKIRVGYFKHLQSNKKITLDKFFKHDTPRNIRQNIQTEILKFPF